MKGLINEDQGYLPEGSEEEEELIYPSLDCHAKVIWPLSSHVLFGTD